MASKLPKTITEQIQLLKDRGMLFRDENSAIHFFENISYYRLKGYWWEMQYDEITHNFKEKSYFEDVIDLYEFDRELRLYVFDALERIEIALRTKLIHQLSLSYGPLWYLNYSIFTNGIAQMSIAGHLSAEISRSKEQFIIKHNLKHKNELPEAWKALEVASLGSLSKIYKNLNHQLPQKAIIANEFGFNAHSDFSSFLEAITVIRNVIAHHSRLWNNNITTKYLWPKNAKKPPLIYVPNEQQRAKFFPLLSLILYTIEYVNHTNTVKTNFYKLIEKYPTVELFKMGFPKNWKEQPAWM